MEVVRAVDGDTVAVRALTPGAVLRSTAQVTVRLLEVDTPETVKPNPGGVLRAAGLRVHQAAAARRLPRLGGAR